jgi:hypothetical protein
MRTEILNMFKNKNVEIAINCGKTFIGELVFPMANEVMLIPYTKYDVKSFGPVHIMRSDIVSIREILLQPVSNNSCNDDSDGDEDRK